jgi:hypothetical protein
MATWGSQSWGYGTWGLQGDINVQVTSANDSPYPWGNRAWGYNNWGGTSNIIPIALGNESVTAEVNDGWGRLAWGANVWGTQATVAPVTSAALLSTSLSSVTPLANANISITGTQLVLSEGNVDPSPDANITGQQINFLSINDVSIKGDSNLSVTGTQLKLSQGDESIDVSVIASVSSIGQVGWGVVAWGAQKWGQSQVDITMTIAEGVVDPAPDANVTGQQLKLSLNDLSSITGNANVSVTGTQLVLSRGSVTVDLNTPVNVNGNSLKISTGTAVAGASALVILTGNRLTITLNNNSVNVQIWTTIDTGTDASWSGISTGTDATWNEVDTAA